LYLNHVSAYLPVQVVTNEHFTKLNGLSDEWIIERTGIRERRKAAPDEDTNTMAIAAVDALRAGAPYDLSTVDFIVGGTYTPHDTIVTLAHAVQHHIGVADIPVVSVSSACSTLLNALEIVQGYFAMGKASRALVIVSDHNTAYNNESDTVAGHLWGDGAAALLVSKESVSPGDMRIVDILTGGAATVGKATVGVSLKPVQKGIIMPNGRDVFQWACHYMAQVTRTIVERNGYQVQDIDWLIPHQANLRISRNVVKALELPEERALSNIERLGNTGCAGAAIALAENYDRIVASALTVITVFGGGYSYGAALLTGG
jgi:3-oxoacyl-[acyl-carrier-protein] synthase III